MSDLAYNKVQFSTCILILHLFISKTCQMNLEITKKKKLPFEMQEIKNLFENIAHMQTRCILPKYFNNYSNSNIPYKANIFVYELISKFYFIGTYEQKNIKHIYMWHVRITTIGNSYSCVCSLFIHLHQIFIK